MSLTGPASYHETLTEFLAHWTLANVQAGGGGLVLPDGVGLPEATVMHGRIRDLWAGLISLENGQEISSRAVRLGREEAGARLVEFNRTVRLYWAGLPVAEVLPAVPSPGAGLTHWLRALREALRVWLKVNAGPAPAGVVLPLVLTGDAGFSRADMVALYDGLVASRDDGEQAELDAGLARAERNALQRRVRVVLGNYRSVVLMRFGEGSPLAESLPRLTPLPGHTPDRPAAALSVMGDPPVVRLTWEALEEATLKCWQVRFCTGGRYDKKRERVAATILPDGERVWETPAATARGKIFRLYAVLETGNERGSRSLRVPS